jgi:hypothetical protein
VQGNLEASKIVVEEPDGDPPGRPDELRSGLSAPGGERSEATNIIICDKDDALSLLRATKEFHAEQPPDMPLRRGTPLSRMVAGKG